MTGWQPDTSVECYAGSHAILVWSLGVPGLVLVAFFLPVATAWHLARNRHQLEAPHFLARYGFLYEEYTADCFAYESVIMLRKLFLSVVLVFLSADSIERGMQVLTALAVICVSILIHAVLHPFDNGKLNRLELLSLCSIFLTLFLSLFLTYPERPAGFSAFGIAILVINAITIFMFVWSIFVELQAGILAKVGINVKESGQATALTDPKFRRRLLRRLGRLVGPFLARPVWHVVLGIYWLQVNIQRLGDQATALMCSATSGLSRFIMCYPKDTQMQQGSQDGYGEEGGEMGPGESPKMCPPTDGAEQQFPGVLGADEGVDVAADVMQVDPTPFFIAAGLDTTASEGDVFRTGEDFVSRDREGDRRSFQPQSYHRPAPLLLPSNSVRSQAPEPPSSGRSSANRTPDSRSSTLSQIINQRAQAAATPRGAARRWHSNMQYRTSGLLQTPSSTSSLAGASAKVPPTAPWWAAAPPEVLQGGANEGGLVDDREVTLDFVNPLSHMSTGTSDTLPDTRSTPVVVGLATGSVHSPRPTREPAPNLSTVMEAQEVCEVHDAEIRCEAEL